MVSVLSPVTEGACMVVMAWHCRNIMTSGSGQVDKYRCAMYTISIFFYLWMVIPEIQEVGYCTQQSDHSFDHSLFI